ncbi:hypothetical protein ACQY0O_005705 [Thecaphora frezii]
MRSFTHLVLLLLVSTASLTLVAAQTCPQATKDQIQTCLDTIEADEAKLPQPCSSSDWACICNKQQGLIECYTPCPELQDYDAIRYNQQNCAGQHGVTNAAAGNAANTYSGSPITTTVPAAGGSGGSAPTAYTSTSSTASATSSTSQPLSTSSSSPFSSTNRSTSSATRAPNASAPASSSSAPNAAASVAPIDARASLFVALFLGAGLALAGGLL